MRNAKILEYNAPLTPDDLRWLGGICDAQGSARVEGKNTDCPHVIFEFKSPFLDLLEAIRQATGGLGSLPLKPEKPSKNQKRPQYRLTFRGAHFYVFWNMVLPFMRIEKRFARFAKAQDELAGLRQQKGLTSPYRLLPDEGSDMRI